MATDKVAIIAYEDRHKPAFKALNKAWIDAFFEMEAEDYKALDHPRETIIEPGGAIFVAEFKGEAVGVCALIKMQHGPYDFELAKMGVSSGMQGKGIGWRLGQAVVAAAKERGASTLFLESNTVLVPAISLYKKMGFQEITATPSPYARSDIQMLLHLQTVRQVV